MLRPLSSNMPTARRIFLPKRPLRGRLPQAGGIGGDGAHNTFTTLQFSQDRYATVNYCDVQNPHDHEVLAN